MAERVLTDAEMRGLVENGALLKWPPSNLWWLAFARAVEQAVLAKVRAERDFLPPTEREAQAAYWKGKQLAAWEREARKRERAAFERGWWGTNPLSEVRGLVDGPDGTLVRAKRDEIYPSIPTCDKCGREVK